MNEELEVGSWYRFRDPELEAERKLTPARDDGKFQCHEIDHDNDGWSRDVLFRGEQMPDRDRYPPGTCFGTIEDVIRTDPPEDAT